MSKCTYSIENEIITLSNGLFTKSFKRANSAKAYEEDGEGLSEPYTRIEVKDMYQTKNYIVWDDLPAVYMPSYKEYSLLNLEGEHWMIRSVKLHAFTDDNDTLCEENEYNMFARNLFFTQKGEIFFLENPETGDAHVIICELPDYQSATLSIKGGEVIIDNGTNGLLLGFCKMGECEKLCRDYFRHAKKAEGLVTMSNTWGDRNGYSRVCADFVLKEIDAAEEIGVDIVQIDDGWQFGCTSDKSRRDETGWREYKDDFWYLDETKFPNGMKVVTDYAKDKGIKVGMWFAPASQWNFALRQRDLAVLKKAYDEWGIRFFKLDMYWVRSDADRDNFLEFLKGIYSFGSDVSVQLDITRNDRLNYLCGRQYGTLFVENRYTKSANSFPHRILRNLWMISKYLPASKFQFELINPDLFTECYNENDPFAPTLYDMDYLFATVMLSNPLVWMEMQFLSKDRIAQMKPLLNVWKSLRDDFAKFDVAPIGKKPNGRNFTGFSVSSEGKVKYLLLFREVTEKENGIFALDIQKSDCEILATNANASVEISDGFVMATLDKPRAYVLVKVNGGDNYGVN